MRKKRELHVTHVFKDGSTDPSKKVVPAELVLQIYWISVEAKERARQRAQCANNTGEDA